VTHIGPDRIEHHAASNVDIASMCRQLRVHLQKPLSTERDDGNVVGIHLAFIRPSNARFEFERRVGTEE
jgi:hypothetical protein